MWTDHPETNPTERPSGEKLATGQFQLPVLYDAWVGPHGEALITGIDPHTRRVTVVPDTAPAVATAYYPSVPWIAEALARLQVLRLEAQRRMRPRGLFRRRGEVEPVADEYQ